MGESIRSKKAKELWNNPEFREKVSAGHKRNPSPTRFKKGSEHWNWSGDKPTYLGVHKWMIKQFGRASCCENPDCSYPRKNANGTVLSSPKRFDWANVSKKYKRDRLDWIQLCPSCHQKWDRGLIEIEI